MLSPWELRSQAASEWQGEIPLPAIVAAFYEEVGPAALSLSTGGNPVNIPALKDLWSHQACYRWHGHTGERLPNWPDHWLVIATEGSNPFILDMQDGQVYFALAGGKPRPTLFAPDLLTAIGALATVANSMRELGDQAFDDTFELLSSARLQVLADLDQFLAGTWDGEQLLAAWRWYC